MDSRAMCVYSRDSISIVSTSRVRNYILPTWNHINTRNNKGGFIYTLNQFTMYMPIWLTSFFVRHLDYTLVVAGVVVAFVFIISRLDERNPKFMKKTQVPTKLELLSLTALAISVATNVYFLYLLGLINPIF